MVTEKQINQFKSRLHRPWSLYDKPLDQYKIMNGYLMHINAHTRIGRMQTGADKLDKFISCILNNLQLWHTFTKQENIIYTLIASNLISYYCSKSMLPWEDDIDLTVRVKDWKRLRKLYNDLPVAGDLKRHYPELCDLYIPKHIPDSNGLYLAFHENDPGKLKVVNHERFKFYEEYKTPGKLRGIDICCAIPYHEFGYIESFWAYRQFFPVCPGPGDHMTSQECPEVSFSGVTTRAILPDFGYPYLTSRYGSKWDAMIQPRLIDKTNGPIPCKMQSMVDNHKINKLIRERCIL
jgi:hypothetical protein